MRSLPIGRLAAWQCLVLSLLVSKHAYAWVPTSSVIKRRAALQSKTSLGAENGVLDFIKGLDSALGNPTAYSAATAAEKTPVVTSTSVNAMQSSGGAVSMNIPNSLIFAGGGVALLAFLGLAFFLVSQNDGDDKDFFDDGISTSSGIEEVVPLPKSIPNENIVPEQKQQQQLVAVAQTENSVSEQLKAAETKFQEQQRQSVAVAEKKIPEPPAIAGDFSGGDIVSKLKAKLLRKTEELEESQELLANQSELREKAESKVETVSSDNDVLAEQLSTKEQALLETTEKWNFTKSKLEEELKVKEKLEAELKVAAEENRVLEDKFELGQNSLTKTRKDLNESNETLETTKNRLTRTQGELTRIYGELQASQKVLDNTSEELEMLEEEQKSLRTLGGKMWMLSKSRVKNRIRSVGDRLRGRGPKKNKKNRN